tara:strand:+ start:323 stop:529 length:207 start_codon:yes stop_codon:yes gene_type:complete
MIDVLTNITELESIKKLVEDQKPRYLIIDEIDKLIDSKNKEVEAFEKTMKKEYYNKMPVGELANDPIK